MDHGPQVPTRVVVPIDDSHASRRALPVAAALAEVFGGELVTVTVADPTAVTDADVVLEGDPAEALRSFVTAEPRTVLCMASHGRSRLGRRLIGSTTEQLLRTCPVPVVVVGPNVEDAAMAAPRTIVAGLAWPPGPDRLVALLGAWAPTLEADVELVHVRSPWAAELYVERTTGRQPPDRPDLDALAERLRDPHIAIGTHPMSATDPVAALIDLAGRAAQPTMIAVDTHDNVADGHHDVAYQLIRRAACPVLATTGRPSER